jgi:hypothetical protein
MRWFIGARGAAGAFYAGGSLLATGGTFTTDLLPVMALSRASSLPRASMDLDCRLRCRCCFCGSQLAGERPVHAHQIYCPLTPPSPASWFPWGRGNFLLVGGSLLATGPAHTTSAL